MRPDPISIALARLGTAWGAAVTPATISGRLVFGGTLREINAGALIHYDDACEWAARQQGVPATVFVPETAPPVKVANPHGLFDQDTTCQLAFNLWVTVPDTGGSTTIWRHRWEPADEQHREAYGYRPEAVEHCQQVTVAPQLGDALLFNPANYHTVAPNPSGRRIAFAFFLALTTARHTPPPPAPAPPTPTTTC